MRDGHKSFRCNGRLAERAVFGASVHFHPCEDAELAINMATGFDRVHDGITDHIVAYGTQKAEIIPQRLLGAFKILARVPHLC